jgi:hypothetical protein
MRFPFLLGRILRSINTPCTGLVLGRSELSFLLSIEVYINIRGKHTLKSWSKSGKIFCDELMRNLKIYFSPEVYKRQFLSLKVKSVLSNSLRSSSRDRSYLSYASLARNRILYRTFFSFLIESGGRSLALKPLLASSSLSESESSPLLYFWALLIAAPWY